MAALRTSHACLQSKKRREVRPEEACRARTRPGRRGRCDGCLLGAGSDQPYHCHPHATEIYFCFEGGGTMRTLDETVTVVPGSFVVHPPGELHEWITGPERTLLFRVRYGGDMSGRTKEWPSHPDWLPRPADVDYFARARGSS